MSVPEFLQAYEVDLPIVQQLNRLMDVNGITLALFWREWHPNRRKMDERWVDRGTEEGRNAMDAMLDSKDEAKQDPAQCLDLCLDAGFRSSRPSLFLYSLISFLPRTLFFAAIERKRQLGESP